MEDFYKKLSLFCSDYAQITKWLEMADIEQIKKMYRILKQEHWKANPCFPNKGEYIKVRTMFVVRCVKRLAEFPEKEWEKIPFSLCMEIRYRKGDRYFCPRVASRKCTLFAEFVARKAYYVNWPMNPHFMSRFYIGDDE